MRKEQEARLNKLVDLLIEMCFDDDFKDMSDEDWFRLKACQYDAKFGYIDKTEDGDWCRKNGDLGE